MKRDAFLARVRAATGGPAPEAAPGLGPSPGRDRTAILAQMAERWRRPHATWHEVAGSDAARTVADLLRAARARLVGVSGDPLLETLRIAPAIASAGMTLLDLPRTPEAVHGTLPQADAGVTVPAYGVAESGTLVELSHPEQPRALSLLPPVHVAVLPAGAVLATLDDLFAALAAAPVDRTVTLISGPSGTADIGLQHVTGVHGPGDLHLVVITDAEPAPSPPALR